MRLRNYSDMTERERAIATPRWDKLCSLGQQTRMVDVVTPQGLRQTAQEFELYVEFSSGGWGSRRWHRYPSDPSVLVFQGDLSEPEGPPPGYEPLSADEVKILRQAMKSKPVGPPDTITPITDRPEW